ncbi:MAG: glycosyltransferase family 2 protein [Candidatus Omnitrophica bacterium]|nr:glycosyltransferase family 2 protein [Candidatus Omnitrophota bacterium]
MADTNKPLFSIIIPTFNCADYLKRALNSVTKQTFKDFEVIICDDGSVDNTKEVVDSFNKKITIKYLFDKNWGGPARPRNNGIRVAEGEFIAFLDSDDWWYANKLEVVKTYLNNYDFIYHDCNLYTKRGRVLLKKFKNRHFKKPIFVDLMKNESILVNSSLVVRTNIIKKVGCFTEEISSVPLTSFEDVDLWLKIARITENFLYIPKCLGAYWLGDGNVSRASEELIKRISLVYGRHLEFLNNNDKKQAVLLMHYIIGRTRQKMGLFKKALQSFRMSIKSQNIEFKIRSLFWIVFLSMACKLSKNNR